MAFSPVAFIAPNFRDFKNYWLKAYEPGTTTPKVMALESDGGTQVAKLEVNKDGFLESAGGALVIPYIDDTYDLWLFPTEAEADANDTVNAERVADDITGSIDSIINTVESNGGDKHRAGLVGGFGSQFVAVPTNKFQSRVIADQLCRNSLQFHAKNTFSHGLFDGFAARVINRSGRAWWVNGSSLAVTVSDPPSPVETLSAK